MDSGLIGMISVVYGIPFRLNPLGLGGLKRRVKEGLLCIAKLKQGSLGGKGAEKCEVE